jgi:chromosome segregation ATPase
MGTVTGGSGDALEGNFLTQRRRIRELTTLLAELDAKLQIEDREVENLKGELEQAETKEVFAGRENSQVRSQSGKTRTRASRSEPRF